MSTEPFEVTTVEAHGLTFTVEKHHDPHTKPWDDEEEFVTDWVDDDGEPPPAGHVVLCRDGPFVRYFRYCHALVDVSRTTATPPKRLYEIVDNMLQQYRGWCRDDWHYIGVLVRCDGIERNIWGVPSYDEDEIAEMTCNLCDDILREFTAKEER